MRCQDHNVGYVATYVPASENAPPQVVGRLQYYIRAGSDFVPAPHEVLAGMFGRRPQPHVFPMYTVSPANNVGPKLVCEYGITITNGGPGIARDLFFTAMIQESLGENTQISWELLDSENWTGNFVFGRQISIISKTGFRLPPKGFLVPLSLRIELQPPFEERILIVGNIGCDGSPTMNIEFENNVDELRQIYSEYFQMLQDGDLPERFRHQVTTNVLNLPVADGG